VGLARQASNTEASETLGSGPKKGGDAITPGSEKAPTDRLLIDFVYCWAGEKTQQQIADGDIKTPTINDDFTLAKDHMEGYGFNEMQVALKSLQLYAPWFNKAYLLVNGEAQLPTWAANDPRVIMVDRCKLFPVQADCPTKNTAACQAVSHLVPGLQEHFVAMQDDFFFLQPWLPSDFFSEDGKPLLTSLVKDDQVRLMYGPRHHLSGPDIPPEHVPFKLDSGDGTGETFYKNFKHAPLPMLVSFSSSLEEEFADWFAFVRSHKTRFTCCDDSRYANSVEEDFILMYPAMLHKAGAGTLPPQQTDTPNCPCDKPWCLWSQVAKAKILTVQNCHSAASWRTASRLVLEHMERAAANHGVNEAGSNPLLQKGAGQPDVFGDAFQA